MSEVIGAAVVDRWRLASAAGSPDEDVTWPGQESAALADAVVGAIRPDMVVSTDPTQPPRPSGLSSVDRATRAWTRTQRSFAVMTHRLSRLRDVVAAVVGAFDVDSLDDVCPVVVATANEEFALRLQDAALSDALTGVGNRRALEAAWEAALAQRRRLGQPVCVVAIDLDGLKRINDFQGHAAGDEAILTLSRALRVGLRGTDQVFRIGGDEFVALLPGTAAGSVGEHIARVEQYNSPAFSWGAADTVQDGTTLADVLGCADRRLYAQRRRTRPAPRPGAVVVAPAPRRPPMALTSRRRAIELAVVGAAALAIGAIVTSIMGGNHDLCSQGAGPAVVNCGVSDALYYGGFVLILAGSLLFGIGLVAAALLRGPEVHEVRSRAGR